MIGILGSFFEIFTPAARTDQALWREIVPFFPVRMPDGTWSAAEDTILRRKTAKGWEYKAIPETEEEYYARQW
jgi:hypothetical protein